DFPPHLVLGSAPVWLVPPPSTSVTPVVARPPNGRASVPTAVNGTPWAPPPRPPAPPAGPDGARARWWRRRARRRCRRWPERTPARTGGSPWAWGSWTACWAAAWYPGP